MGGNSQRTPIGIEYDGARVSLLQVGRVGLSISRDPETYILADTFDLPGDLSRTALAVDSSEGRFVMKSQIGLHTQLSLEEAEESIVDTLIQIKHGALQEHGIGRYLDVEHNRYFYIGDSGIRIGLYIDDSNEDGVTIHLSTKIESDELTIEPLLIDNVNCSLAIAEFTALWLIVMREIEKATSPDDSPSAISLVCVPEKISDRDDDEERGRHEIVEQHRDDEISFDDIGGNHHAKEELLELAHSINNPEILAKWGVKRPNGILLYGPAGTGKTTLVEAFANEIGSAVWKIDSSEIVSKWLGQSQKNLRALFDQARAITEPTIMFFDEFDSIIQDPQNANDGASRERQATAGMFKQELETLSKTCPHIILVAATNYPDRISDSVKRSGRFDKKIYVSLPNEDDRVEIFSIKIANISNKLTTEEFSPIADDINTRELSLASDGFSGADITTLFESLLHKKAVTESRTGESTPVTHQEIMFAIQQMRQQ